MNDNKVLAILIVSLTLGLTTVGVVKTLTEKSDHEKSMEQIQEIREYTKLMKDLELEEWKRKTKHKLDSLTMKVIKY